MSHIGRLDHQVMGVSLGCRHARFQAQQLRGHSVMVGVRVVMRMLLIAARRRR